MENTDGDDEPLAAMTKEESDDDDLLKPDCQIFMFDLAPIERFARENML